MYTWQLWRALNSAQFISPLFRRIVLKREAEARLRVPPARWLHLSLRLTAVLMPVAMLFFVLPALVLIYFGIQALSPVLIPLAYSVYGIALTMSVSSAIAREHELHTYETLGVTPPGRLGIHWLYCVGWLHRSSFTRLMIVGLIGIGIVAALLGIAIPLMFRAGSDTLIQPFIRAAASGFFFAIDFMQTIVIASLLAMLAPTFFSSRAAAQQLAVSGLIVIQLISYSTAMVLGVVLHRSSNDLLYPMLIIGIFALLREGIIIFLWYLLHNMLNSTPHELRL